MRGRRRPGSPIRVGEFVRASEGAAWLVDISRSLNERGYEIHAIVGGPRGGLTDRLEGAGVRVHVVPMNAIATARIPSRLGPVRNVLYGMHLIVASVRLARVLRREQIDVLHSHIFMSILIARLAGWLARTPVTISMVPGPSHLHARPSRAVDRATWRLDDRVVASCDHTAPLYRELGLPQDRRACIYYGADPRRFDPATADGSHVRAELGIEPPTPLIGLVAYFYPPHDRPNTPPAVRGRGLKGHEFLIAAAPAILKKVPEARIVLVGDGLAERGQRYRRRLQAQVRELGLGDRVLFSGYRTDIPDVLAALDVAVQCSLIENLGGTIESLLMETPTVATRVGGMPETVLDGKTGLLVPPADPDALARAILELLGDPERAARLARAGRRRMLERFTLQRTVADLDALLAETWAERVAA